MAKGNKTSGASPSLMMKMPVTQSSTRRTASLLTLEAFQARKSTSEIRNACCESLARMFSSYRKEKSCFKRFVLNEGYVSDF